MKLTITIQGREAIPVRAIPLITGWGSVRVTLDPFSLAHTLYSGKFIAGFTADYPLKAYPFPLYELSGIKQGEWETYVHNLQDLQRRCEEELCDYKQWQQRAIIELPSGVFLWMDEFEQFWYKDFLPRISMQPPTDDELLEEYNEEDYPYSDERERITNKLAFIRFKRLELVNYFPSPPFLNYDPYLSSEFIGLVLDGFIEKERSNGKQGSSSAITATEAPCVNKWFTDDIGTSYPDFVKRGRPSDQRVEERNEQWIAYAKKLKGEKPNWSNMKIAKNIEGMKTLNQDSSSAKTILNVISPHITKK